MSPVFDLTLFFASFQVAGVPLIAIVIGLVQWVKKLSPNAIVTRIISALIGLLLGIGYWFSANPAPTNFAGWFTAIIFGLALGILASSIYDAGVDVQASGQVKAAQRLEIK